MLQKQEIHQICSVNKQHQHQSADSLTKNEGNILPLKNTITSGILIDPE